MIIGNEASAMASAATLAVLHNAACSPPERSWISNARIVAQTNISIQARAADSMKATAMARYWMRDLANVCVAWLVSLAVFLLFITLDGSASAEDTTETLAAPC